MSRPSQSVAIDLAREADFALGAVQVRPSLRAFIVDGREELLEPRIMQVLVVLARRRGEVVTRDDLMAQCWGGRIVWLYAARNPALKGSVAENSRSSPSSAPAASRFSLRRQRS